MSSKQPVTQAGGMSLGDIYFTLFRHKWKILIFSVSGLFAAGVLLLQNPALYESKTKLDILYVVQGRSLNPTGGDANTVSPADRGNRIISTEVEILRSMDVMMDAVQAIGAEKILAKAGGGNNTNAAAALLAKNLTIESSADSSVIQVALQHPDPDMVQSILTEIIASYFRKHNEIYQGGIMLNTFSVQETNRLYKELAQTKEKLRAARVSAGIFSADDTDLGYQQQISQIRTRLFAAQTELAERKEALNGISAAPSPAEPSTNAEIAVSPDKVDEYRNLCTRLDLLQKKEQELLLQYTDQSVPIKDLHAQIADDKRLKLQLEKEEPGLTRLAAAVSQASQPGISLSDDAAQIELLETRINILNSQLTQLQNEAAKIDESKAIIADLGRREQRQEAELEYFQRNLEQTRINELIGDGKVPGISPIQSPSSPVKERSKKLKKMAAMCAAGGVGAGLALAFLMEMLLDRSLRRPIEIETKLGLPVLISIPDFSRNGHLGAKRMAGNAPLLLAETASPGTGGNPALALASQSRQQRLRPFCNGLRDRLIIHFEIKNVTHKPKLVAVTSCGKGAGVSSVAAGVAASLSETGDGKVLLVDMNVEGGAAQLFYKGKLGCGLDAALEIEARKGAQIQENLYVAAEPMDRSEQLPSILPSHFMGLIPKLRASDYDYIIFDMPAVTQTSLTPRLARVMDMVLLVIESEKTDQDVAGKVVSLLAESAARVTTVLNKAHSYVPARLHQEFLNDF